MPLSFAHSLRRLDSWQQRAPVLGIPVAVIKKFLDDGADRLGVQIAYWGFFSVFALLLVFASILGFVFQSNPDLQRQLLDSTLERMPVIGPQIRGDIGTLTGSGAALAVGLVGALWTGLGVTLAIATALDRVWDVPQPKRAGFVSSRLRGLLVLVSVGAINVLATVAVGLATAGGRDPALHRLDRAGPQPAPGQSVERALSDRRSRHPGNPSTSSRSRIGTTSRTAGRSPCPASDGRRVRVCEGSAKRRKNKTPRRPGT